MSNQAHTLSHIAIIMDGNRRWAKKQGLSFQKGHQEGVQTLLKIADYLTPTQVSYLTIYTFSTENWQREEKEVQILMKLLLETIKNCSDNFNKKDVRIKLIGNKQEIDSQLLEKINQIEILTRENTSLQINVAFNYGGKDEILHATKKIASKVKNNTLDIEQINEKCFSDNLYTKNICDPDLLIRTGGRYRISNFLLWQLSYTELYFSDILWPDFSPQDLQNAMNTFRGRKRSFGGN